MAPDIDYQSHRQIAEAKAKAYAIQAYLEAEQLHGWAFAAQLPNEVLEAATEARSATRRIRNLLLPDETFDDDPDRR